MSPIDTTFPDKSNSTKLLQHQRVTVSVYDSGYYVIPGFKFVVNNDTAHPLFTKPLFLEVHTVPTDSSAKKIKDIKLPLNEPFNWEWYIEYLYAAIAVLALVLIAVIIAIYYARKRKNIIVEPEKPKVPAHITALSMLEKIKQESVWQEGKVKEYYSSISDTLRLYIEERFGVYALESTTDEIMAAFRAQVVDKDSKDKLQQLLTLSDLVKFAKQTPIETEHYFTLQHAFDFVNGTKREEEYVAVDGAETPVTAQSITMPSPTSTANQAATFAANKVAETQVNSSPPKAASVVPAKTKATSKWIIILAVAVGFILLFLVTYYVVNKFVTSSSAVAQITETMSANPTSIEEAAALINKQCPITIDAQARVDSAVALPDNTLRTYFTLTSIQAGQIDPEAFKNMVRPMILSQMRGNPLFKIVVEQSGSVECIYNDAAGRQITIITITPADYLN